MKEMTRIRKNHLGGSVKKTLFVMALAMALVFVVAGTAMALPTYGGQNRAGAPATATAVVPVTATETVITGVGTPGVTINGTTFTTGTVTPGSDTLYGAGTNTYENWSLTINYNGNAGTNSPHGNFTTTTVKCVVCHAVHYAAPGGAPAANGNFNNGTQVADTLLRMRADQACVFCHATAGQAVNGTPVYDGIGVAGGLPGSTGGAFNTGHVAGTNCSVCHSSVHGANADHSVASLDGFLLLKLPVSAVGTQAAATSDMLDAIKAVDFQAQNEGFAPGAPSAGPGRPTRRPTARCSASRPSASSAPSATTAPMRPVPSAPVPRPTSAVATSPSTPVTASVWPRRPTAGTPVPTP